MNAKAGQPLTRTVPVKVPGFRGFLHPDLAGHWPRDPEALRHRPSARVFKEGSRSLVFRAVLGGRAVVIKRRRPKTALERWRVRLGGSRARRSHVMALALRRAGVRVPFPLGAIEARGCAGRAISYLVMTCVDRAVTLHRFLTVRPPGHPERVAVARRLGRCLGRLHGAGFRNRDLKAQNLLVEEVGRVWLVDLDGVARASARTIRARRARDLARLMRDVEATGGTDRAEIRAFVGGYWRGCRRVEG